MSPRRDVRPVSGEEVNFLGLLSNRIRRLLIYVIISQGRFLARVAHQYRANTKSLVSHTSSVHLV